MKDEVDLITVISILWRKKFLVLGITLGFTVLITVIYFLCVTPLYTATAEIDHTVFSGGFVALIREYNHRLIIEDALTEKFENPREIAKSVVLPDKISTDRLFSIAVTTQDPELSAEVANLVGIYLMKWHVEYHIEQQILKADQIEEAIFFLQMFIIQNFEDLSIEDINMSTGAIFNPAYEALMNKKGALLIEQYEANLTADRLARDDSDEYKGQILHPATEPKKPSNINWLRNIITAASVGFMFSILKIFFRPITNWLVEDFRRISKQ